MPKRPLALVKPSGFGSDECDRRVVRPVSAYVSGKEVKVVHRDMSTDQEVEQLSVTFMSEI